jgi:hypothetical protein
MAKTERCFADWKKQVDALFEEQTGCTWTELRGDEAIRQSYDDGKTPKQFVDEYCERMGLWDIRETGQ